MRRYRMGIGCSSTDGFSSTDLLYAAGTDYRSADQSCRTTTPRSISGAAVAANVPLHHKRAPNEAVRAPASAIRSEIPDLTAVLAAGPSSSWPPIGQERAIGFCRRRSFED